MRSCTTSCTTSVSTSISLYVSVTVCNISFIVTGVSYGVNYAYYTTNKQSHIVCVLSLHVFNNTIPYTDEEVN